ncbi:hypothetical protein [Paenarthrobacter sp. Y-19]|uniref:hypothetical protein n=1 Tax=Paenarthrobacter sp. Y-19 TaxID=3031125 RepID=UPI0023DC868C|nr:hypothetical protein [Paenarthrobacter sp. Y-19]
MTDQILTLLDLRDGRLEPSAAGEAFCVFIAHSSESYRHVAEQRTVLMSQFCVR